MSAPVSSSIHPTAIIGADAHIEAGVEIGPYCVIESGARIGAGCKLAAHIHVYAGVTLGDDTHVGTGSVLGGPPQDTKYAGERSFVEIGSGCRLHESVTVHRATGEGERTLVAEGVMLMAGAHVGHNCEVGAHTVMVNDAMLGGHAKIGERALLSGSSAVHQFCRVGRLTLIGGACMLTRDAPPFSVVVGSYPPRWRAVNTLGLRRGGMDSQSRSRIRRALAHFFAPGSLRTELIQELQGSEFPELAEIGDFAAESSRGLCSGPGGTARDEVAS